MRDGFNYVLTEPFPEFHHPLLMTGWAKVTAFARKSQQVFMAAVLALDPGKSIEKNTAIQIPLHNLSDMGAKKAVYPFKSIFIDLLQSFKVIFDAAIIRGLFGISGTIYGCRHGHVPGDCILFAISL